MLIDVVSVEALPDYRLSLEFSDGKCGVFDMSPYLNIDQYAKLKDSDNFNKVHIECFTASWPGGIDIASERLYSECIINSAVDAATSSWPTNYWDETYGCLTDDSFTLSEDSEIEFL